MAAAHSGRLHRRRQRCCRRSRRCSTSCVSGHGLRFDMAFQQAQIQAHQQALPLHPELCGKAATYLRCGTAAGQTFPSCSGTSQWPVARRTAASAATAASTADPARVRRTRITTAEPGRSSEPGLKVRAQIRGRA